MKKNRLIYLVTTAVLAALVVVLQLVGGIPVGPFSITLTLFPIVVGAVVLGPLPGLFLGIVFGVVVSILSITGKDPGGQMVFAANPVMAWFVCILKGALAGFVPAVAYGFFSKRRTEATVMSYITAGIFIFLGGFAAANSLADARLGLKIGLTALFALIAGGLLVGLHFLLKTERSAHYIASILAPICNTFTFVAFMVIFFRPVLQTWAGGSDLITYTLTGLVGINFLIEFSVAVILTPALVAITNYTGKRIRRLGFNLKPEKATDREDSQA